jgi:hypothetical protein
MITSVVVVATLLVGYVSILLAGLDHYPDKEVASRFLGKRVDCLRVALGSPAFDIKKLSNGQPDAEFPIPTYERPKHKLSTRVLIYRQRAALLYVFVDSSGLIESVEICKT